MTTVLLAIIAAAILPFVGLDALIRIQSKENYDIAKNEVAKYAHAVQEAKIDKLIAIPSRLYFLYKTNLPQLGDEYLIGAEAKPSDIGGIVECQPGSSYRENETPGAAYLPPVVLFAHTSTRYTPHLLGHRVTRHDWGWSCDQYLAEPTNLAGHACFPVAIEIKCKRTIAIFTAQPEAATRVKPCLLNSILTEALLAEPQEQGWLRH